MTHDHPHSAAEAVQPLTDRQRIVAQTEDIARLLLSAFYGLEPVAGVSMASACDHGPRARKCWRLACDIQDRLANTDPVNALAELAESTGASIQAAPAPREFG